MATHPRNSTLVAFGTALVLTLAAFALVEMRYFARQTTVILIGSLGVLQVFVHFRYFLQLRLRAEARDRILTLAFAAVVGLLMAIGTLWIIADLKRRMMPEH
jgi:cytochrome o ubiquinol oxidase operon protein cyoD